MGDRYVVRQNSTCEFKEQSYEGGDILELTEREYLERQHLVDPYEPPKPPKEPKPNAGTQTNTGTQTGTQA